MILIAIRLDETLQQHSMILCPLKFVYIVFPFKSSEISQTRHSTMSLTRRITATIFVTSFALAAINSSAHSKNVRVCVKELKPITVVDTTCTKIESREICADEIYAIVTGMHHSSESRFTEGDSLVATRRISRFVPSANPPELAKQTSIAQQRHGRSITTKTDLLEVNEAVLKERFEIWSGDIRNNEFVVFHVSFFDQDNESLTRLLEILSEGASGITDAVLLAWKATMPIQNIIGMVENLSTLEKKATETSKEVEKASKTIAKNIVGGTSTDKHDLIGQIKVTLIRQADGSLKSEFEPIKGKRKMYPAGARPHVTEITFEGKGDHKENDQKFRYQISLAADFADNFAWTCRDADHPLVLELVDSVQRSQTGR